MYAKQEQQMTWPNAWLPLIWLCLASPPLSQQGGAKGIAARIRLDFNLCGGLSFISLLSLTFTLLFSRHFYLQFFLSKGGGNQNQSLHYTRTRHSGNGNGKQQTEVFAFAVCVCVLYLPECCLCSQFNLNVTSHPPPYASLINLKSVLSLNRSHELV